MSSQMLHASETCKSDISGGVEVTPIHFCPGSPTASFEYSRTNIPGPGTPEEDFEVQFEGCACQGECADGTCPCVDRFGPVYDSGGLLSAVSASSHQLPVFECNRRCSCTGSCSHRLVQHGVQRPLEVYHTDAKGYGLRPLVDLCPGCFVCEYAGEVLTKEEARSRSAGMSLKDDNYIIVLKEHLGSGDVIHTIIDAKLRANVGRFINHSCDPNLHMIPVRVNNNIPKLALFARKEIKAGTELTFNYAGICTPDESMKAVAATNMSNRKLCLCGSSKCSQWMPFDESLF